MKNQLFKQKLFIGHSFEKVYAKYMNQTYGITCNLQEPNYENLSDHQPGADITFDNNGKLYVVEIKCDIQHGLTGNLFIEMMSNNKPSGLQKTDANLYIFFSPIMEKMYIIKTDKLNKIVKNKYLVSGGYNHLSKGYLINPETEGVVSIYLPGLKKYYDTVLLEATHKYPDTDLNLLRDRYNMLFTK